MDVELILPRHAVNLRNGLVLLQRFRHLCQRVRQCFNLKIAVKIIILSVLGVLLVGSSVAYAYSQKGTLISQKTEELPDGNIYVEELYEIDQ